MVKSLRFTILGLCGLMIFLVGCEPLAPLQYDPSPIAIVITNEPTATVLPTITPSPTITRTPIPTPTPDFTPTPTEFPCQVEGQILDITDNRSEVGGGENLRYRVYVPPCYFETQARFPLIILLHGLSYREQQWEDLGLIAEFERGIFANEYAPAIIVMPYMGNLGQLNRFPPDPSFETFIVEELLAGVERNFCTLSNPNSRAIGGISRGGFWAYSIGFRNPDIFGALGGHSAFFPNNINEIPPPYNPLELAVNDTELPDIGLRLYLDNGANDSSGPSQQLFSSRLASRGISHDYVVHPTGEHNNDYWSRHVAEYLDFYTSEWERDYDNLLPCAEPSP